MSDRLMPTSSEAEEAVVACLLRQPELSTQMPYLRRKDFSNELFGAVYEAIGDLTAAGRNADWRVIGSLFEGRAEKVSTWLQNVSFGAPAASELPEIARSVRDLSDRRRLIMLGEEMADAAAVGGRPATDIAAQWAGDIAADIGDNDDTVSTYGALAEKVVNSLNVKLPCCSTGIAALDRSMAGGLFAGKLYGVLARMKAGKTLLASTIAFNAAERGAKVLYLPLEMGGEELVMRMMARRMKVNSLAFLDERQRGTTTFQASAAGAAVADGRLPLLFQTKPRMALDGLRQTIARCAIKDGIVGVVLDYLQLVTGQGKGQSQAAFLDEVTQSLAEAAKSFGLWILVAAQENQTGNVRGGEGLLMACDMTMRLHRIEGSGVPKQPDKAWLETLVTRYTIRRDVGTDADPALMLDTRAGPAFVEIEQMAEQQEGMPL